MLTILLDLLRNKKVMWNCRRESASKRAQRSDISQFEAEGSGDRSLVIVNLALKVAE